MSEQIRDFIASARRSPAEAARAVHSHRGIEGLHGVLDIVVKEDLARLRRGHGARSMALVRRCAFNDLGTGRGKHSFKAARKAAGWKTSFLGSILNPSR